MALQIDVASLDDGSGEARYVVRWRHSSRSAWKPLKGRTFLNKGDAEAAARYAAARDGE